MTDAAFPAAVAIGTEAFFWDGTLGARYDVLSDAWTPISLAGAPSGPSPSAVWTGSEVVVLDDLGGGDDLLEEVDAHHLGDLEPTGPGHAHGHGCLGEAFAHVGDQLSQLAADVGMVATVVAQDDGIAIEHLSLIHISEPTRPY